MSTEWDKTKYFERESNIYSFAQNPLLKRNQNIHLFMPWNQSLENEMMFKIKDVILTKGHGNLPLMSNDGSKAEVESSILEKLAAQIGDGRETHLIMSNLDSIHIFRIAKILTSQEVKEQKENNLIFYNKKQKDYSIWIQVDDLFVLDANHDKDKNVIAQQLDYYASSTQTQNVFKPILKLIDHNDDDSAGEASQTDRWVDMNRSLTYDYFIRSCELKDNIFQTSWKYLDRKTQHELISCELERHNAIFYRDQEKWNYLKSSFDRYTHAIYSELNSIYIFPFINAIATYPSLKEAWCELGDGLVNPKIKNMITELLSGKRKQLDCLSDFLYYTHNAKSLLFTLKRKFIKKIHKEEFLLVENFLCRQESLVESMNASPLLEKLQLSIEIAEWIERTNNEISLASNAQVKDCNLRLSHLLSIMVSASYQDNLFFRLIEEKVSKGIVQKSYEDVVRNLLCLEIKKAA